MQVIRFRRYLRELEIRSWWQAHDASARAGSGVQHHWEQLTIESRLHAAEILGRDDSIIRQLRHTLSVEGSVDLSRISDFNVLDTAVEKLTSKSWLIFIGVEPSTAAAATPTRATASPAAAVSATPSPLRQATARRQPISDASPSPRPPATLADTASIPPAQATAAQHRHWIEIELVGEDGKGIPREQYHVVLPDGQQVDGFLDENGFVRIDNVTVAGNCKVSFPQLDAGAWHLIDAQSARAFA